jgi:peptidoglycan hydrolase CwlO-like protein
LEEQKASLSQLTHYLQQLQQKVDRLSSQAEETQAREREWELKLDEQKQTLRKEAATQSLIRDSDQVIMRKELRDIQSRLRLLQVSCWYIILSLFLRSCIFRIFFSFIMKFKF